MKDKTNKITLRDLFGKTYIVGSLKKPHVLSAIISLSLSILIVTLLAVDMGVAGYINRKNIEEQCVDELEQTTKHLSEHVASMLESDKQYLEFVANIISVSDYNIEEYKQIVANFSGGQLINKINLLLPDGTVVMRNMQTYNEPLVKERFDMVVSRGYFISKKGTLFLDNSEGVYHSYPVMKDGEAIAVIVAFMDLVELDAKFSALSWYDDSDQMFIVEANSKKLILDTLNEEHGAIQNFFSLFDFGKDNEGLINDIEAQMTSTNVYTSEMDNVDYFICTMGIDIADWVLLLIVPEEKVLEYFIDYNNTMNISYCFGILLIAVLIVNLTLHNRKQILLSRKAYAKEHGEKTLLDNVYSTMPTGILRIKTTGMGDEIIFANKAAANLLGFSDVEELLKCNYEGTSPNVYHEDKKKILAECDKLIHVWDTVMVDARVVHSNNEIHQIRGHNTLIMNEGGVRIIQRILYDITDEIRVHQVENDIRRAHYFNQIFNILSDKTSDAYILFSLDDFSVEYVSENIERLLGFDIEQIYTEGLDAVRPEGMDPKESRGSILSIPLDQSMYYERIRTLKNGEVRIFEDSFYVTEMEGERKGLAIFSDVTEDRRARQTLAAALDNANNASKAKTDFLYNMSHDIRTPMNAIYGLIKLLSKDIPKDSHAWKHLEMINVASESMLEIINNILDMSRIESGKIVLNEEAFNVEDVIEEIEVVYTEQAKNKGLILTKKLALAHKQYIGDYVRLKQIITNLLSNSIKYTNEGGSVNLSVHTAVDNNVDYDVIRFKIEDTGIGMSEEFLKVIFTPFAREKSATQSGVSGTGLGMAIVKNLTELMGGHVTVLSVLGKGTTITIEIPFKRVDAEIIEDKNIYGSDITTDINGVKILVVEDNDLNAGIVTELLEDCGAICKRAINGKVALDMFMESEPGTYDVILMDIQMPVMNGYEASMAIRASEHPQAKKVIIVAMTANAFIEDVRHAFDAGMDCHISKPIYIDELCKTLNLLLKK